MNSSSDLSKHLQSVGIHNGDTSKCCTNRKILNKKWLRWNKFNLSILELGKLRGVVDLGSSSLLSHLPQDLGHLACNLSGTAENDGCVSGLEDTRVLLDSDQSSERLDGLAVSLLLDIDDISWAHLLFLGDTLDGETNRVSGSGGLELLLVLFDGEHLLVPEATWGDSDNISGAKSSLLDGSADDLSNSLNVVDVRDGKTDGKGGLTLRGLDEVVEGLNDGKTSDLGLGVDVGLPSLVPGAFIGLLDKVVSVESRVGDEGDLLGLEPNHGKHLNELLLDLSETFLRQ